MLYLPVGEDLLVYSHGRTGLCGPSLPRNQTSACVISYEVASCSISSIRSSPPSKRNQLLASSVPGGKGLPGSACGLAGLSWQGVCLASLTKTMPKKKKLSLSFDDDYVAFDKYRVFRLILIL